MLMIEAPALTRSGSRIRRGLWLCLAYGCVGLGAAGVVVPLLPTTPFLLLALYAAGRSSPHLRWRLLRHPRYGASLRAWQRHRAIPVRAKLIACVLIAASWLTLWALGSSPPVLLGISLLFVVVLGFILSRPSLQNIASGPRGKLGNTQSHCAGA
ncbi:MAG: DUF454 domain-containing protein, partial [Wenzhouxiangellaceae bacterium]